MTFHYIVVPVLILLGGLLIAWLSVRRMMSLRTKGFGSGRKTAERILLSVVALVAVLLAVSSGINVLAFARFRHARGGAIYQVDGHAMHIDCMGRGSPAIVLESGLGDDGLVWGGVQPTLAKTTRVCSYDRAGYGWSDAVPPPRDADHIAMELHGLLAAAGIEGPIVLMGHSVAGIYIRDYATRYTADVAGLIFVEAPRPCRRRTRHSRLMRPCTGRDCPRSCW